MIQIDINAVGGVVLGSLLIAAIGGLIHLVFEVKRLIQVIGGKGEGLIGRVFNIESEVKSLRDWALINGYNRRHTHDDESLSADN